MLLKSLRIVELLLVVLIFVRKRGPGQLVAIYDKLLRQFRVKRAGAAGAKRLKHMTKGVGCVGSWIIDELLLESLKHLSSKRIN